MKANQISNPQARQQRRQSRLDQMEMMEAAARGTKPSMQLERIPDDIRVSSRNDSGESIGFHDPLKLQQVKNSVPGSVGSRQSLAFRQHTPYAVDQSVNLMDSTAATYGNDNKTSFFDIFFGGSGNTSGAYHHGARRTVKTTWARSHGGRLALLVGVLLIVVFVFVSSDGSGAASEESGELGQTGDRYEDMRSSILQNTASSFFRLDEGTSSAAYALQWISGTDPMEVSISSSEFMPRFALASFFYATNPNIAARHSSGETPNIATDWKINANWMTKASICDWHGVTCATGGAETVIVKKLNLTSNKIAGTIPLELRALSNLDYLDLSHNRLEGSIPTELTRMYHLLYFLLHNNRLVSTIPRDVGFMESLNELSLSHNQLTGTIPATFSRLSNLRALKLDANSLTGTIPVLRSMSDINFIHLSNNELTGPIPFSISHLHHLYKLELANNKLTGTIHSEIDANGRLQRLWLSDNEFTGTIPDVFHRMHSLTDMELHGNRFTNLPKSLGELTSLKRLTLSNNIIGGSIPPEWAGMTDLEALQLSHNKIVGSIPPVLGRMTNLRHLLIGHNLLIGSIPSELGLLKNSLVIDLANNAIKGKVPAELGKLMTIQKIRLGQNRLTGAMPDEVCVLTENYELSLLEADCKNPSAGVQCNCCSSCV